MSTTVEPTATPDPEPVLVDIDPDEFVISSVGPEVALDIDEHEADGEYLVRFPDLMIGAVELAFEVGENTFTRNF